MEMKDSTFAEVGRMMREIYRVFRKRIEEQQGFERLSPEQFRLLHSISCQEEEVIQKDLAEMMGKDKSALLRLVDTLEERELVRRVADIKDRRKNFLMVTKAGQRVMDQYMRLLTGVLGDIEEGLSREEMETFHRVVNHMRCNAQKLL